MEEKRVGHLAREFMEYWEGIQGTRDELPLKFAFGAWASGKGLEEEEQGEVARRVRDMNMDDVTITLRGETAELLGQLIRRMEVSAGTVLVHALQTLDWKDARERQGFEVKAVRKEEEDDAE